MRNGPLKIAWDVICPSPVAASTVREILDRAVHLDAVQTVAMTGGGTVQEEAYRLGDFFQDIRVEAPSGGEARTLRVVFERLPNAGRYWRDLMVRVLQSVRDACAGVQISMAFRVEDSADERSAQLNC